MYQAELMLESMGFKWITDKECDIMEAVDWKELKEKAQAPIYNNLQKRSLIWREIQENAFYEKGNLQIIDSQKVNSRFFERGFNNFVSETLMNQVVLEYTSRNNFQIKWTQVSEFVEEEIFLSEFEKELKLLVPSYELRAIFSPDKAKEMVKNELKNFFFLWSQNIYFSELKYEIKEKVVPLILSEYYRNHKNEEWVLPFLERSPKIKKYSKKE